MNFFRGAWMFKLCVIVFLLLCALAISLPERYATLSMQKNLHLKKLKDPIDGGWLPDITGLPTIDELEDMEDDLEQLVNEEKDLDCRAIHPKLRKLFFEHFMVYQKMANAQDLYLNKNTAIHWAHIMALTLKESDGDSTNITDFEGHTYSPSKSIISNLDRWRRILTLSSDTRIKLNFQTNFGLTQISADRVFVDLKLAKDQSQDTNYLEGLEGADTQDKTPMNTAIAARRLIWLYQDFAQGRIRQEDDRIHLRDSQKPENLERLDNGIEAAIRYCGTKYLFAEWETDKEKLKEAMASIAYCKLGHAKAAYRDVDELCFAKIVTLCPALNIDIATLTPLSYFATRDTSPVCESTFMRLLTKKPSTSGGWISWLHDKWRSLLNRKKLI